MTDDLDDLEVDEADIILCDLVDLGLEYGISALELVKIAVERIPELHAQALADLPRH